MGVPTPMMDNENKYACYGLRFPFLDLGQYRKNPIIPSFQFIGKIFLNIAPFAKIKVETTSPNAHQRPLNRGFFTT
jgi:hypothetical protein